MTQHAFTSTVFKQVEPGQFMVRFRDEVSYQKFAEGAGIPEDRVYMDLPSDYPWRVKATKAEVMRYFEWELDQVDYSNFKSRATKSRGQVYHDALMKVWTAMLALTPSGTKTKMYDSWDAYDRKHGIGKYRPKAKGSTTVVYTSGSHPSVHADVVDGDDDEEINWEAAEWWYKNFPPQHRDTMDADADFTDLESDALVEEVDELFRTKSVHDLTEDEWRALMEENPGGI